MKKTDINLVKIRYRLNGDIWERVLTTVYYTSGTVRKYDIAPCTVLGFIYNTRCIDEKYNHELGICDRIFARVGVNHGC